MKTIPLNLSSKPGIYLFKNKKGNILYIGKAKNILKRVQQYFSPGSVRKQDMVNQSDRIDYITTENETEALELEDNLIKHHKPTFNSLLRENNYYVYIKIPKEDFPQIFIVKKRKNDGATYIGPKYHSKELRNFLQFFRQLLKYRGCKMTQFRQWKLCSDYYFGLCKGRCHKASAPLESKDEYSQITTSIQKFFEGDIEYIENLIKSEIQQAIDKQYFERAAKLRDMLFHIDKVTETQRVILDPKINGYFFKIQLIGSRYVYVITKFFEGKLIDIITGKNPLALEGTLEAREQFLSSFTVEFGESLIPHNETFFYTKKQKKSTLQEIEKLSENLLENYIAKTSFEKENVMNDLLIELQARYHIKDFPYHIECIDISHLSGGRTSGGLSCFLGGIPHKYGYRRYKINCHPELVSGSPEDSRDTELNSAGRNNSDDYAALREVILRRFKKDETTGSPHLFILDGGKGQLSIISKIKKEFLEKKDNSHREKIFGTTTFISLGKGAARKRSAKSIGEQEEIFYFNQQGAICSQKLLYDQVDRILTHIRDEAHRFANNYRRKQMSDERK